MASGGYRLLQRLGSGAAGTVYLAETGAGQVAIRQFESRAERGSEAWQRARQLFLAAGRDAVALRHPRIVSVLEVIDEGGEAFVVSEHVAAETLEAALSARRLPIQQTGFLLQDVAAALDYAHGRGVVHGDLKPSDVFLAKDRARVADFQISPRAHLQPYQPLPLHMVHPYLSPEHFRSPLSVDARSDQYSLAVLAYRTYTGQFPYGRDVSDLPAAIVGAEIQRPSWVEPQLPPEIDQPLLKALSRDPAARFGSCSEFIAVLGASLISQPGGRGIRPVVTYAALGTLAAALAGVVLLWPRGRTTTPVKPPIPNPPPVVASAPPAAPPPVVAAKPKETRPAQTKPKEPAPKPAAARVETLKPRPPVEPRPLAAAARPAPARRVERPPYEPRPVERYAALPPQSIAQRFRIEVFSRTQRIENGSSFSVDDQVLGELAHGDLRASVAFDGPALPRGELTLEWALDGLKVDSQPVTLNRLIEYDNEPSSGTYVLTLRLNGRPLQSFTFRISP